MNLKSAIEPRKTTVSMTGDKLDLHLHDETLVRGSGIGAVVFLCVFGGEPILMG
jgi:hypothetical protein